MPNKQCKTGLGEIVQRTGPVMQVHSFVIVQLSQRIVKLADGQTRPTLYQSAEQFGQWAIPWCPTVSPVQQFPGYLVLKWWEDGCCDW
jgi:hypothetical protein